MMYSQIVPTSVAAPTSSTRAWWRNVQSRVRR